MLRACGRLRAPSARDARARSATPSPGALPARLALPPAFARGEQYRVPARAEAPATAIANRAEAFVSGPEQAARMRMAVSL
ncbi:hypothetical protein QLQ97_07100 [Burkholderia pseudomallei]|uniref:hypothetical protein n=1 Tax=Burkholderia pseudomallei TaxID=28450 RepID=UPI001FAF2B0E|nr:hypothetical protein [Burkholderia pseudomallei]MDI6017024.1 hypothetical protein [Burkholderia pseudomallei]MDY7820057.1 hypothetical protein [Burkholderia pseudomallei]MDY7866990.1 hypothetical protein [Burkholderia pseudomallei]